MHIAHTHIVGDLLFLFLPVWSLLTTTTTEKKPKQAQQQFFFSFCFVSNLSKNIHFYIEKLIIKFVYYGRQQQKMNV